jgi:hypothetical protein
MHEFIGGEAWVLLAAFALLASVLVAVVSGV